MLRSDCMLFVLQETKPSGSEKNTKNNLSPYSTEKWDPTEMKSTQKEIMYMANPKMLCWG